MAEGRDPPMDEPGYMFGPTVVQIEDLRVSRGLTRRPHSSCQHTRISYDPRERRVWCRDCEHDVEAFDAFVLLVERFDSAWKRVDKRASEVREAETFQLRSRAAKAIDKAWRRRSMVPACPHCHGGLFPKDFADGRFAMLGVEYALARAKKQNTD